MFDKGAPTLYTMSVFQRELIPLSAVIFPGASRKDLIRMHDNMMQHIKYDVNPFGKISNKNTTFDNDDPSYHDSNISIPDYTVDAKLQLQQNETWNENINTYMSSKTTGLMDKIATINTI